MYPPSPSPSSMPLVHQTRPSHYKGKTKVRANEDEAWRSMEDQGASATHLFAFDMYPPSPSPSSMPLVHQTRPSHYKGKTKVRANEDEAWRSMEDQGASGKTKVRANREPTWCGMEQRGVNARRADRRLSARLHFLR
ncbi:hypothetical protein V8C86DRAFT_3034611 [Haematococcus lacustris]